MYVCVCRLVPQESGGRAARTQAYSMLSITGDAVLLEFQAQDDGAGAGAGGGAGGIYSSNSNNASNLGLYLPSSSAGAADGPSSYYYAQQQQQLQQPQVIGLSHLGAGNSSSSLYAEG
jgi:hypothetical protein